jgi:hypothetical protein
MVNVARIDVRDVSMRNVAMIRICVILMRRIVMRYPILMRPGVIVMVFMFSVFVNVRDIFMVVGAVIMI